VQDLLGLGSEARLNTPGCADGNWSWCLRRGQLTAELAERLRAATAAARRLP
jgi:4-alpha-glucanotransferase